MSKGGDGEGLLYEYSDDDRHITFVGQGVSLGSTRQPFIPFRAVYFRAFMARRYYNKIASITSLLSN